MSLASFSVLNRAVETYHFTRVRVASLVSRLPPRSTCRPPGPVGPRPPPVKSLWIG